MYNRINSTIIGLVLLLAYALCPAGAAGSADWMAGAKKALPLAGPNAEPLGAALTAATGDEQIALAFLIANMSQRDLRRLTADFLTREVRLACRTFRDAPWRNAIPQEVFLNDVLPYANLDETREDWRKDLHDRFAPVVADCKTPGEAALKLNAAVFRTLKVQYHPTKRPRPNQSPSESIKAGYASCTGLSILLVDACRAVGVPARVAGTPLWTVPKGDANGNHAGNHTWVEVWDRQWHYLGASEVSPLDQTWFGGNASRADPDVKRNWIYAASFQKTDLPYWMVWSRFDQSVSGENVTAWYKKRARVRIVIEPASAAAPWQVTVRLAGCIVAADVASPATEFSLAAGCEYEVHAQPAKGGAEVVRKMNITAEPEQTSRIATK